MDRKTLRCHTLLSISLLYYIITDSLGEFKVGLRGEETDKSANLHLILTKGYLKHEKIVDHPSAFFVSYSIQKSLEARLIDEVQKLVKDVSHLFPFASISLYHTMQQYAAMYR